MPPLVKVPSASRPYPILVHRYSTTCCSIAVAAGAWSNESIDWLNALISTSAASDGNAGGQCRCARYAGWVTTTDFSASSPVASSSARLSPTPSGSSRSSRSTSRFSAA
ncbi:Uncharacterised protein [Mycobacteroides abscessus subsp. abscessus]|nr:Uncharacterised protein [Mycobacteroides abscessus subsp. abscessus]